MSKQVGTCRFYVDIPTYLNAIGLNKQYGRNEEHKQLLYIDPSNPWIRSITDPDPSSYLTSHSIGDSNIHNRTNFPVNFMALLNHNFAFETSDPYRLSVNGTPDDDTDDIYAGQGNAFSIYCKATLAPSGGNVADQVIQYADFNNFKEVLNMNADYSFDQQGQSFSCRPQFNGSSIFTFDTMSRIWNSFGIYWNKGQAFNNEWASHSGKTGLALGSFVIGKYYDVPFTPDLNLTMSRRFDGIKKQKTIGGKVFGNSLYNGPTEWTTYSWMNVNSFRPYIHDIGQFELEKPHAGWTKSHTYNDGTIIEEPFGMTYYEDMAKSKLGRKGLRSWELTFSYISDNDMWMSYETSSLSPYGRGQFDNRTEDDFGTVPDIISDYRAGYHTSTTTPSLDDESFNFVWNTTLGGTLPFIFQPDKNNNASDQFAICVFRDDTLDIEQIASNVYRLKVTIDEVA